MDCTTNTAPGAYCGFDPDITLWDKETYNIPNRGYRLCDGLLTGNGTGKNIFGFRGDWCLDEGTTVAITGPWLGCSK